MKAVKITVYETADGERFNDPNGALYHECRLAITNRIQEHATTGNYDVIEAFISAAFEDLSEIFLHYARQPTQLAAPEKKPSRGEPS
jgi:hypothetical protein